jgi:Flp pilus assembly protein TadG
MRKVIHFTKIRGKPARGQSLLELALLFPLLLIIISGLVEFGFLLNDYLSLMDAARNSARFASDGFYSSSDNNHSCATTVDFFRQTACVAVQELSQEQPNVAIDPDEHDDIVISVFSILSGSGVTGRYPSAYGSQGWSYALDLPSHGARERSSSISTASVNSRLDGAAPNTGLVLVELFYTYEQKLKLPWITAFLGDPLILHVYSFMPLVSAEPRE